jgi:rod shape determining protein RodA
VIEYAPRSAAREHLDVLGFLRRLDWILLLAVGAVVAYGLWAVAGITRFDVDGDENYYVVRQAIAVGLGFAGFLVALAIDPEHYRRAQKWIYGLTLVGMLLVFPLADATRGSKRWIEIGPFQFQPSEFGKLLLVLSLAAFLAERGKRIYDRQTTTTAIGLAAVPILLVFLQPDFGTAIVYAAILGAALFIAGTRWSQVSVLLGLGVALAAFVLWVGPAIGVHVLKDWQLERITGFLNPSNDPGGATWNITQSITAVGAGGVDGRGTSGATQTNYNFLPEHATDFVFASSAEQRGFLGVTILLLLYLLVIWRALKVITLAREAFAAIAAGAIAVMLLVQIFINVGMTIGMAPITGIPLPFVSVGGSSMVANLLAIGVLQSICVRRR